MTLQAVVQELLACDGGLRAHHRACWHTGGRKRFAVEPNTRRLSATVDF